MIDLNPNALTSTGLCAYDVVQAVKNQNVVDPCGTVKMGEYEYIVNLNDIPDAIDDLNKLPVKSHNGAVVYLKDVAQVHDGWQPQLNIVNLNGHRAVLLIS